MYDIKKATSIAEDSVVIGYIFPVSDEYWLPLDVEGNPCGPPSYKADATNCVKRQKK